MKQTKFNQFLVSCLLCKYPCSLCRDVLLCACELAASEINRKMNGERKKERTKAKKQVNDDFKPINHHLNNRKKFLYS